MLVEVRTIDELQIILDGLWPGRKAGLRREDYAGLFVAGEPDDEPRRPGPAVCPDGRMLDEQRSRRGNDLVREVAPA